MRTPVLALTPGDDGVSRDLCDWFGPLAAAGLGAVVIREPQVTASRLGVLCEAARAASLRVWVHDRHPSARTRPEGLHLTAVAPPPADRAFGQSCHDPVELDRAFAAGATYASLSPVFRPTSKPDDDREPIGVERFVRWAAGRPVYALGGITPARSRTVREHGGYGVAVLGTLFGSADPQSGAAMVRKLLAPWLDRT